MGDIYAQPGDDGHAYWAFDAVTAFAGMFESGWSVLDVGCGTGFAADVWEKIGLEWTGVTLGDDANAAIIDGRDVRHEDFSFLRIDDKSYDVIFARHVLEHSPFPLLTLMEWYRVARKYLLLVAPTPEHWGYRGRNHYSVMEEDQIKWLCERAGWQFLDMFVMTNHDDSYLATMDQNGVGNALRVNPPLNVEYRMLFKRSNPVPIPENE